MHLYSTLYKLKYIFKVKNFIKFELTYFKQLKNTKTWEL